MVQLRAAVESALMALIVGLVIESPATGQLHPPVVAGLRGAPFPAGNPPPNLLSYGEGPEWDGKTQLVWPWRSNPRKHVQSQWTGRPYRPMRACQYCG